MSAICAAEPEVYPAVRRMEDDLHRLGEVLAHYPSILDRRSFGDQVHSVDTLVETLYRDGCNHTVLLPAKVAVGRSAMVAKFHLLGFLILVCDRHQRLALFREELYHFWESALFSLLLEEVYQVIIEREGRYSDPIRRRTAIDLIHLWEYRVDRNLRAYVPILIDLWRVRKRVAPVFGTMLGTMELMRISVLLSERWHRFLMENGGIPDVVQALEEFIFGLTHEQIVAVRVRMRERELSVVDREELLELLGEGDAPAEVESTDPRDMYRFYQKRSQSILKRTYTDLPGPRRTLEEVLLVHLLEEGVKSGYPQGDAVSRNHGSVSSRLQPSRHL